jgi:hypothetical protein
MGLQGLGPGGGYKIHRNVPMVKSVMENKKNARLAPGDKWVRSWSCADPGSMVFF